MGWVSATPGVGARDSSGETVRLGSTGGNGGLSISTRGGAVALTPGDVLVSLVGGSAGALGY